MEAEAAKNKIASLKTQQMEKSLEKLQSEHLAAKVKLEQTYEVDLRNLNSVWEKRLWAYTESAQKEQEHLRSKHSLELSKSAQEAAVKLEHPRPSPAVLNLKKVIKELAKQQEYMSASELQSEVRGLEEAAEAKLEAEREKRVSLFQAGIVRRQEAETRVLNARTAARLEALKKQKETEIEKLVQKYQNLEKALEVQHGLEVMRIKKRPMTAGFGGSSMCSAKTTSKCPTAAPKSRKLTDAKYFSLKCQTKQN
eukprot:TRINITY_DN136317_c2_g1_i1.p2 TRINITY_DN136317_c2_g1~~TRINITY_DN136317_c2_g1_i1.p2  ORF type:complete len:253 (-),score=34.85 TRINITY_DN136317_c2_g1_i1:166-924(-)